MDLKSYLKNRNHSTDYTPPQNSENADVLKQQTEELSRKSEPELLEQLMQEVERGKREGSFSAETLNSFAEQVAPMLNDVQKKRLEELSVQLKNQLR